MLSNLGVLFFTWPAVFHSGNWLPPFCLCLTLWLVVSGYIVFSGVRRAKGVQGLRVIIQSSRTPAYVEGRVEAFLQKMEVRLWRGTSYLRRGTSYLRCFRSLPTSLLCLPCLLVCMSLYLFLPLKAVAFAPCEEGDKVLIINYHLCFEKLQMLNFLWPNGMM